MARQQSLDIWLCLKNIFEDTRGTPEEIVADKISVQIEHWCSASRSFGCCWDWTHVSNSISSMESGCNSLQWVKHYNLCKRKKTRKGFVARSACSIWTLKSGFHSILVSVLVCEIKGSKSFEWGGWTCALEMRQNNVEKHSKNARTHNTRGPQERAPQLKTTVNSATAASTKVWGVMSLTVWTICFYFAVLWLMYTKICGFVWSIFADAKGTT
jgi:hypothetical protein